MPELLPCPFCGSATAPRLDYDRGYAEEAWYVVCGVEGCGTRSRVFGSYESDYKQKAAKAWNTRATPPVTAVPAYICTFNHEEVFKRIATWLDDPTPHHVRLAREEAILMFAQGTTAVPAKCDETLVDEVQRRMDAVVDAAVEWHQAGGESNDWFQKGDTLAQAIESLLELREFPAPAAEQGEKE